MAHGIPHPYREFCPPYFAIMSHRPGRSTGGAARHSRGKGKTVRDSSGEEAGTDDKIIAAQHYKLGDELFNKTSAAQKIINALKTFMWFAVLHDFKKEYIWSRAHDLFMDDRKSMYRSIEDAFPEGGNTPGERNLAEVVLLCFNIIGDKATELGMKLEGPSKLHVWRMCWRVLWNSFTTGDVFDALIVEVDLPEDIKGELEDNFSRLRLFLTNQRELPPPPKSPRSLGFR
ncbi:hypothetical protein IMZ48_49925 [Candidatus Bathyarchaeota archaeon]|nr:hypothetical protein [Candidatus Bathyarchaeota archaeon]